MIKNIIMPSAGQTTDVATITAVKVAVGDSVKRGDILLEVETDKAVLPIESIMTGIVTGIFVNEFDKVDAGTPLLSVGSKADYDNASAARAQAESIKKENNENEDEDDFQPIVKKAEAKEKPSAQIQIPAAPEAMTQSESHAPAMPSAKREAEALGIALSDITPENGRFIKKSDVITAAEAKAKTAAHEKIAQCASEKSETADDNETVHIPTSRMRKTLARRAEKTASEAPVFGASITVRADAVLSVLSVANARECADVRIGDFVILALSRMTDKFPCLKTRVCDGELSEQKGGKFGYAFFGENGTVSAFLRADGKGLVEIAAVNRSNAVLVSKGNLECVGDASVTVFDLSSGELDGFTPPLMTGEVCTLAIGGCRDGIIVKDGAVCVAKTFTVTGTFDLRYTEGNTASALLSSLKAALETPTLLLL